MGENGSSSPLLEPIRGDPPTPSDEFKQKALLPQITLRSIIAGLAVGSIVLFSNFQFGLQTGWVSMMGLPSSLLSFAIFKSMQNHLSYPYSDVENVFAQSLAVAVGTGPLAFGLVGVVPALEKFLTPEEAGVSPKNSDDWHLQFSLFQLIILCSGLAFFGVFFAVLLRRQIIVKEKLKFPSGSASATLISVLHKTKVRETNEESVSEVRQGYISLNEENRETHLRDSDETYLSNIRLLSIAFSGSAGYTVLSYFLPVVRNLPIFGSTLAKSYLWTFQPSPAYIGQGIIMGLPTVSSMLFGAFLGWAVLAPMAYHFHWVTGPIDDWQTGGQGWILWISLTIMLADTIVSFLVFTFKSSSTLITDFLKSNNGEQVEGSSEADGDAEPQHLLPQWVAIIGLALSTVFCIAAVRIVFGHTVPVYITFVSVALAMLLSILGVRALGETDLNPVSGIGKISQLIIAMVIDRSYHGAVLVNLVAGAITEAGAQQAGDLMQDLKTGHIIGASPRAQFVAQIIGSVWSIFLSAVVYRLYNSVYEIPGPLYRVPTALVWIDCSRLMIGSGVPINGGFLIFFAVVFGSLSFVKAIFTGPKMTRITKWFPSGIATGIGIYNTPSFTLARFVGGGIAAWYLSKYKDHDSLVRLVILSSGLILGEGVFSIVSMILTSLGVPHW